MNNDKKIDIQQQRIEELEQEVKRLQHENDVYKQIFPNKEDTQICSELFRKLREATTEANAAKKQYDAAYREIILIKKQYRTEIDDLLARLRNTTLQVESANTIKQ